MSQAALEKRIVVTGGAGFIGSALIWELNRRGYEDILVVDQLGNDERWKNLVGLKYFDYLEADDFLKTWIEGRPSNISSIFHLGACSSTTETDCRYLIENNYRYTMTLAEHALNRNVRFVYASSAATYGDGACGMDDRDLNLSRLRPLNMYGYSKHMVDLAAQRRGWLEHLVGLKYFNIFGPNEYHKGDMRSVIHKGFEQIRDTGRMRLFKSYRPEFAHGCQMRDFCYVKDAVSATVHLATNCQANGLFNVGSGNASTWLELIHLVFEAMGLEPIVEFIEMPESLRSKYQYYTCADTGKLCSTGWVNGFSKLSDGVRDYVSSYLMPGRYLADEGGA